MKKPSKTNWINMSDVTMTSQVLRAIAKNIINQEYSKFLRDLKERVESSGYKRLYP